MSKLINDLYSPRQLWSRKGKSGKRVAVTDSDGRLTHIRTYKRKRYCSTPKSICIKCQTNRSAINSKFCKECSTD